MCRYLLYNSHELIVNRWTILRSWRVFRISNTIGLGGLILGCHSAPRLRCFLPILSFGFPLKHHFRHVFTNGIRHQQETQMPERLVCSPAAAGPRTEHYTFKTAQAKKILKHISWGVCFCVASDTTLSKAYQWLRSVLCYMLVYSWNINFHGPQSRRREHCNRAQGNTRPT